MSGGDNSPREYVDSNHVSLGPLGGIAFLLLTVAMPSSSECRAPWDSTGKGLCPLDCFLWRPRLPLLIIQAHFSPVYFSHFHMCLQVCVYMCIRIHVGYMCVGGRACHPVMFAPGSLRRVSQSSPELADAAFPGQLLWRPSSTSEAGIVGGCHTHLVLLHFSHLWDKSCNHSPASCFFLVCWPMFQP